MSPPDHPPSRVLSLEDTTLVARIVRRCAMRYVGGADAASDRPEHVRAASGLAWVGDRLAVIQDDASFLALVDPATGLAEAFALPAGAGGARQFDDTRENKADKLDLEALTILPSSGGVVLAAFGSGSMAPRETVVLISFAAGGASIAVRGASELYARLRGAADFAGSEMNVEGVVHVGGTLTLFGRGNGAVRGELRPVNASCEVPLADLMAYLEYGPSATPPTPTRVRQYDLGELDDVSLGFTDVALGPGGAILYSAAAEASPDATRDGEVRGSVLGTMDTRGGTGRWARLSDGSGTPFIGKVEGVTLDHRRPDRLFAAVDSDDHRKPSELLEVHLLGPWWA